MSVTVKKMDFPGFFQILAAKDEEIANSEVYDFWDPLPGTYSCHVVGCEATIFKDDKTDREDFCLQVRYKIIEGEFVGKQFRSQSYNFSEQGLPWTRAFVRDLGQVEEAPSSAHEIQEIIEFAVKRQMQLLLDVKQRSFTTKAGEKRVATSEKILQNYGPSLDEVPEDNVGTLSDEAAVEHEQVST